MLYPSDALKNQVESLPNLPGVYQYFDKAGKVIYVGKAKNLKKRVASYFTEGRQQDNRKLQILVAKIVDLKFTVVSSEAEAFLLENTYIKKLQPRYNVLLKDDKSYPCICVKKEPFPRIFPTRRIVKDGSKYFGPYSNIRALRVLLDLIRALYPLRTCPLPLNASDIASGKFKSCLDLQIGTCKAPCIARQSEEEYSKNVAMITSILRGDLSEVKDLVKKEMLEASGALQFELANELKGKLHLLADFQSKSTVANATVGNVDVFCLVKEGALAYSNFMRIANGSVVYSYTVELNAPLDNPPAELLSYAILGIKEMVDTLNKEIIVPFLPDEEFIGAAFTIPQRGDKLNLLSLSERNCRAYIAQRMEQLDKKDPEVALKQRLEVVKQDLHLSELPYHIECFDNSNTQGTNPVAACVVFKNAKPSKKDYRHFLIKTVDSPNDYASMEEVLYRRYRRLLDEGGELPQLIVVDGGKGQLSSAVSVLRRLGLMERIGIVGLAKRLEEIFLPDDSTSLYLNKNSFSLRLLMQLRDEAHRFGITFHRKRRSSSMLQHELNQLPGVGEQTINKLLSELKTLSRMKQAGYVQVAKLVGKRPANALKAANFFE
ncbi:MAG: excinuclease ABC subunit UvrC [Prevotellaceae bacterium]|jgi:excinuclease ABC subunit C|nr:excinuclease ABC subunit UvrC [Prevotellaceae bacterium]